jgi:hypothetical protein
MMQRKYPCHKNDDDMSKVWQTLDAEPKSSCKNSTGYNRALDQQSDADVDVSEASDAYHLPMLLKYCAMLQAAKTPEFTFRKEPSDIDKLVMAIGSLTTSMHESHKSELKFCKDEWKNHESNRRLLSELCEITMTQASEARQHKQTILNGIEAMGNNIAKVISSEIHVHVQAMSAHVDVLNQVSLDAIMKRLNTSNHAKETPNSPTVHYTMTTSESLSMSNSNPTPSWPKDESPENEEESKHSPPMPTPPKRSGPKCPPFPTTGPTSRGHPHRPVPGGSDDNGGGGGGSGGSGRRPPAGGDPGNNSDPDDNPGPDHNLEMDREGDSPPLGCSATPAGYNWSQLDMSGWDPNPTHIWTLSEHISETCNNMFRGQIHEAIWDATHDILRCTPVTSGTYAYLKTIATGTPMPSYNGEDNLEVFMMWIHSLMCFYDIHQIVGPEHDHNRTTILHAALKDLAQTWYNMTIWIGMHGLHMFPPAFLTILLKLADMFVTPAAVTKAQCSFNKITSTKDKGIRAYVHELQMTSKHILLPIDEYTLQKWAVEVIPSTKRNSLIDLKGLSTSTSSVTEWVEAIAQHKRELLKKAAFNDIFTNPTRFGMAIMRWQPAWVTTTANRPTSNQSKQNPGDAWSNEHTKPLGLTVQPQKPILLAEITCHTCSKMGHYHGSKKRHCQHKSMHLGLELSRGRKLPLTDTMKWKKFPPKDLNSMAMPM